MTKHKNSSYDLILEKALEVVIESGAACLTFEAVAKKSGISRGGILYHFPSKQALLQAILNQYVTKDMDAFNKRWVKLGSTPETIVKAELLCATEEDKDRDDEAVALLAAVVNNPSLLDNVKPIIEGRYEVARGLDSFEKQATVLLALDGVYMLRALGLQPLKRKEREKIYSYLLSLLDNKEAA
jgi:AcrR family transcriptional regulator